MKRPCKWCGVHVFESERSVLVPKCHRWCVIGIYDETAMSIADRVAARSIRRQVERSLRRVQA